MGTIVPILLIVGGAYLAFAAFCFHYGYYKFWGPGFEKLSKRKLKKWRIVRNRCGGRAVDRFVDIVKKKAG